eukprot:627420-Amphidinium_carterae.1
MTQSPRGFFSATSDEEKNPAVNSEKTCSTGGVLGVPNRHSGATPDSREHPAGPKGGAIGNTHGGTLCVDDESASMLTDCLQEDMSTQAPTMKKFP